MLFNNIYMHVRISTAGLGGSVGCTSDWWSGDCWFDSRRVANILSWRFDHKLFSRGILSLPLIQEGQLSVSGERMCTILVTRLEDWAYPVKVWPCSTWLQWVDWAVKPQHKTNTKTFINKLTCLIFEYDMLIWYVYLIFDCMLIWYFDLIFEHNMHKDTFNVQTKQCYLWRCVNCCFGFDLQTDMPNHTTQLIWIQLNRTQLNSTQFYLQITYTGISL